MILKGLLCPKPFAGGVCHEGETIARSGNRKEDRGGGKDQRRHHHPRHGQEKPIQGRVIAAGKGKVTDDGKVLPLEVKEGDKVLFGKYAGTEVKIDGEEHLIMREDDILAIIT